MKKNLFLTLFFSVPTKGTFTGENGSSASGHRFTVDESSVYWTQQAHEDQRPQFKNDHQKPESAGDAISSRPPLTMESLQPPPMPSSRPPTIYRTDDELQDGGRREDDQDAATVDEDGSDGDNQFVSSTHSQEGIVNLDVSGSVAVESNDFHDYDDGFKDLTTVDRQYRQPTAADYDHDDENGSDNWKAKQHRWTSDRRQRDDEDGDDASTISIGTDNHEDDDYTGYQVLTCPATNNFYTHFRW